jgi:uncharacterized membrane protein
MTAAARGLPRLPAHRALVRFSLGLAAGSLAAALCPPTMGPALRAVAGWDAAALAMGAATWWLFATSSSARTRSHAATEDPGRTAVSVLVLVTSVFSLFATAALLRQAPQCPSALRGPLVSLCLLAVASAWLMTHTVYTLRYAHLYYSDGGAQAGGLEFPGAEAPSYVDFAYFAFTLGMCFQVSDVSVTRATIRRTVLFHALLAFLYNTVILAVALNFAVGSFG